MKDKFSISPLIRISPILGVSFLNFIIIFLILIVFYSFLATPSGFEIRMPSSSEAMIDGSLPAVIRINSENVLYFNGKVVTINDLKRLLYKSDLKHFTVYVQVDNRASMGRVSGILQMCKGLNITEVKVTSF